MTNEISRTPMNHIIGHARTIKTTLLCVEYLKKRHAYPQSTLRAELISFRFHDADAGNGFWSSDIFVEIYPDQTFDDELCTSMIDSCRAFVAGAGEVWT